jgi:hypothetical protein
VKRRSRVDDPPAGDHRLSLWHKHAQQTQYQEEELARIVLETGETPPVNPKATVGDDARKLRGIPVTGVPGGMGGTIADTDPLKTLLKKEQLRERHWG